MGSTSVIATTKWGSNGDAAHATLPGYPTPYFIDGLSVKIDKPNATVLGQSIAAWTADWWTWTLQAPLATNPLLDLLMQKLGADEVYVLAEGGLGDAVAILTASR